MAKKIITYILGFILVITLLASVSLTILNQTILKKEFIVKLLEKNEYYSKMCEDIHDTFINNTVQTGLDESILDGIITEEQIKKDVNSFVNYLYGNGEISIDTEKVKSKLEENINKEIEKNGKKLVQGEQESIDRYVNKIGEIYENGITYVKSYVKTIRNAIQKVHKATNMAQIVGYIATLVFTAILTAINKGEVLKYISICVMGVGALLVVPKIVETCTLEVHNILMFNLAFSEVLINLIGTVISTFMITGIILFVIGLMLSIATTKIDKE